MIEDLRFYDEQDGWIECAIKDSVMYISVHCKTEDGKYSREILRKLIAFGYVFGTVRTELRYNYLVDFYSKHFDVTDLGSNIYEIKRRRDGRNSK